MKVPLMPRESASNRSAAVAEPEMPAGIRDPVAIANASMDLRDRKLVSVAALFDKIQRHEVDAEQRVKSWLEEAQKWIQPKQ